MLIRVEKKNFVSLRLCVLKKFLIIRGSFMIIHVEKDKQELPLVKLTVISQLTTSVNAIFRQIFR